MKSEKLRDACTLAVQTLQKLKQPEFGDLISKLEFCIGSYNFDKNPSGLIEYGHRALGILKEVKKQNTRKVSKEVLTALEEGLS